MRKPELNTDQWTFLVSVAILFLIVVLHFAGIRETWLYLVGTVAGVLAIAIAVRAR